MLTFSFENQRHLSIAEFVKWILSFCSNIDALRLTLTEMPSDLHNEIVRLQKLKNLHIGTSTGMHPKEVTFAPFARHETADLLVVYQELPTVGDTSGGCYLVQPTRFG